MWQCAQCREEVEDNFDVCWNCGTSADGVIDPEFQTAVDKDDDDESEADDEDDLSCLRCGLPLRFAGSTVLEIGNWNGTIVGEILEGVTGVALDRRRLDVHVCPQCRHAEFFLADKSPPTFL